MTQLAELIIFNKEAEVIKAILQGADVNEHDKYGMRPLIQAIICKKLKVITALLEHGADIEQIDILGRTPLAWAVDREEFEIAEFLLEQGANPNHYSADGQPILVNPILREQLDFIELFKKYNADFLFPQDFISAKLIGHRFELSGETDIVSADGKFIPLSYEGFYLEFSTELMWRSLNNFINSIEGQEFKSLHGKLNKVLKALKKSAILASFAKHKDKEPFYPIIDEILKEDLLLLPAAFEGHAITFIKYGNYLAKCDRGVNNIADTVIIYNMGNPYRLTRELLLKLLYEQKTSEFIRLELKQELKLKTFKTLPTKSQIAGNCSWANVETSVPAMLFLLLAEADGHEFEKLAGIQKKVYNFYRAWLDWDKDSSLDEAIEDFHNSDSDARKISKAVMFGSVLTQRCSANNNKEVTRAKKILNILTEPNYVFILKNYRNVFTKDFAGKVGKNIVKLFKACGLNIKKLTLKHKAKTRLQSKSDLVKMTTALHVACLNGEIEVVKYLLEKVNIDINYLDRTGSTALMYAAWRGHVSIVKYMLDSGADIGIRNNKGGTAYQYAMHAGHSELGKYLK